MNKLKEKYGFKVSTLCQPYVNPHEKKNVNPMSTLCQPSNEFYECDYCEKKFKSRQGKSKHQRHYCKEKRQDDEIDKMMNMILLITKERNQERKEHQEEKEEFRKEKDKLRFQIKDLMAQMSEMITKVGNNNNNKTIIINNYGSEDISYIKDSFYKQLFTIPYESIPKLIKQIHFNSEHPENKNIRIKNKKSKYAEIYSDNEWKKKDKEETINDIMYDKLTIIDEKYNDMLEEDFTQINKSTQKKYMNFVDKYEHSSVNQKLIEQTENILIDNAKDNTA